MFFCLFCVVRHSKHEHSSKGKILFIHAITTLSFFTYSVCDDPRKKNRERESLTESYAYNRIRESGETLGEREVSLRVSPKVSPRVSERVPLDSWWYSRQDSWRDFWRSPSVSPESRIRLYAWLSGRLSRRLVFFTRGKSKKSDVLYL